MSSTASRVFLIAFALLLAGVVRGGNEDGTGEEVSQPETESRVKNALAKRLEVDVAAVAIVKTESRTWPDQFLGCMARRGLTDSFPVEGYRVELAVGERHYVYHTDRKGRFIPCDKPKKPLGPIQ